MRQNDNGVIRLARIHSSCSIIICLLFTFLQFGFSSKDRGSIDFVQITDPHMFEKKPDKWQDTDNNKIAFAACIYETNRRMDTNAYSGSNFKFVVVTGDLGLEAITGDTLTTRALDTVSAMIERSIVRTWLF